MIGSLKRGLVSLLLSLTLGLHCLAFLEGDDKIRVSFSIWSPILMDLDLVEEVVSDALQSFLCQEGQIVVVDSNLRSACSPSDTGDEDYVLSEDAKSLMLEFIRQTDPDRSYISDDASHVLISDANESNSFIKGTIWDVDYQILQVGTTEIGRSRMANFTDEMEYLELRIQQRLDLSIVKGVMNQRFRETEILIGKLGQDFEILSESSSTSYEDSMDDDSEFSYDDSELSYAESALILRYTGYVLLAGSFLVHIILLCLGRCYNQQKERKEVAALDPEYQNGLITEEGVTLMLAKGRRESERMPSSSRTL